MHVAFPLRTSCSKGSISASPCCRYLATVSSEDSSIFIEHLHTGCIYTVSLKIVTSCCFVSSARLLISDYENCSIIETNRVGDVIRRIQTSSYPLRVTSNGTYIAVIEVVRTSLSYFISIYDYTTGQKIRYINSDFACMEIPKSICFTAPETLLVYGLYGIVGKYIMEVDMKTSDVVANDVVANDSVANSALGKPIDIVHLTNGNYLLLSSQCIVEANKKHVIKKTYNHATAACRFGTSVLVKFHNGAIEEWKDAWSMSRQALWLRTCV